MASEFKKLNQLKMMFWRGILGRVQFEHPLKSVYLCCTCWYPVASEYLWESHAHEAQIVMCLPSHQPLPPPVPCVRHIVPPFCPPINVTDCHQHLLSIPDQKTRCPSSHQSSLPVTTSEACRGEQREAVRLSISAFTMLFLCRTPTALLALLL